MKSKFLTVTALSLSATHLAAGGLDRAGQDASFMFESGDTAMISFASVSPDVSGTYVNGALNSGSMSPGYTQFSLGYKRAFGENFELGLTYDQPYGADVDYSASGSPATKDTKASVSSSSIKLIGRYHLNENISAHAGLNYETIEGSAALPAGGALAYEMDLAKTSGTSFLAGVAYEMPEIALRVGLTYFAGTKFTADISESSVATAGAKVNSKLDVEMPNSIKLDFQSGVAADTLVFGSIRKSDWSDFKLSPDHYKNALGRGDLYAPENDVTTINVGIGRKFSDNWSGAISYEYEKSEGGEASDFAPVDGRRGLGLGVTYTQGNLKISTGLRYVQNGDATTGAPSSGDFTDNTTTAIGVKLTYSY